MKQTGISRFIISCALAATLLLALPGMATAATAQWSAFRGGSLNGVTPASAPYDPAKTDRIWKAHLKDAADWETNVSDPLVIDGDVYVAVGSELRILDGATGAVKHTFALDRAIDFTCRMVFANDTIFVPLPQGVLEAIAVDPLAKRWATPALAPDPVGGEHQAQTTLAYDSGRVYLGTACADWSRSYAGTYQCIDATTGALVWAHDNPAAGYYWSGGTIVNGAFIFAGDDGILTSVSASTGATITPTVDLGAPVRSTIVSSGEYVLAVSQDGTLHRVTVKADGSLEDARRVSFADSSTSTPAVHDGMAYVGGTTASWTGSLSVIDVASMTVAQTIDLPAAVQGSPIIATNTSQGASVYFTVNDEPGALYVHRTGDAGAAQLYTPTGDEVNYAMSTPAMSESGVIYYTNDSGYLLALAAKPAATVGDDPASAPSGTAASSPSDTEKDRTEKTPPGDTIASADVETGDAGIAQALCSLLVAVTLLLTGCASAPTDDGSPSPDSHEETASAQAATATVPAVGTHAAGEPAAEPDPAAATAGSAASAAASDPSAGVSASSSSKSAKKSSPKSSAGVKKKSSSTPKKSASGSSDAGASSASAGASDGASQKEDSNTITVSLSIDSSAASNEVSMSGKSITIPTGSSVYDALKKSGVTVAARSGPMGTYVYSINSLAEKAHGADSGWVYYVNGSSPSKSCSKYTLSNGDRVTWKYKK